MIISSSTFTTSSLAFLPHTPSDQNMGTTSSSASALEKEFYLEVLRLRAVFSFARSSVSMLGSSKSESSRDIKEGKEGKDEIGTAFGSILSACAKIEGVNSHGLPAGFSMQLPRSPGMLSVKNLVIRAVKKVDDIDDKSTTKIVRTALKAMASNWNLILENIRVMDPFCPSLTRETVLAVCRCFLPPLDDEIDMAGFKDCPQLVIGIFLVGTRRILRLANKLFPDIDMKLAFEAFVAHLDKQHGGFGFSSLFLSPRADEDIILQLISADGFQD